MVSTNYRLLRHALLAAASTASMASVAGAAEQGGVKDGLEETGVPIIISNHLVPPGPGVSTGPGTIQPGSTFATSPAVLSPRDEINGIGQQIKFNQTSSTGASLGLCTGSLINPRTVLTAAHCVYDRPAHAYGSVTGTSGGVYGAWANAYGSTTGTPISFGFESLNRGCADENYVIVPCPAGQMGPYETWLTSGFKTSTERHIYNGNQVWYHPDSTTAFALADIALVTLDTHAKNIPTWTLLFSPLTGPTHAEITGYGRNGSGQVGNLGTDYRRRSAENMIDALTSRNSFMKANTPAQAPQQFFHQLYWLDFDDPTLPTSAADLPACYFVFVNCTDANALGGHTAAGRALPNEGGPNPGDSGGPLIVDRLFTNSDGSFRKVIAAVASGVYSYTNAAGYYGENSVYVPLYQFWQDIVRQNPYVYASALEGDGDWFDPSHWIQDMDPNYGIIGPDGNVLMALPNIPQGNGFGATAEFGTICATTLTTSLAGAKAAFGTCTDISQGTNPTSDGPMIYTEKGPGSTNFVPNNIEPVNSADPTQHVWARYYDVTLGRAGTTTLNQAATIDMLTLDHSRAKLDIKAAGTLNTWADYTQWAGWTNVDGTLNTNEMLVVTGLLSGRGVIKADYLTVVAGIVAPGGADKVGTLTVNGDVILASASSLFVDASRNGADKLVVSGTLDLNGGSIVFNKPGNAPAPRHGDTFTVATAGGGIEGRFGNVYSFQGVLRPELSYGANSITALLRAGSLVTILEGQDPTALAFASALDALRGTSYNNLYGLYGAIDLMDGRTLSATLAGLTPRITGETRILQDRQSRAMMGVVTDRLSMLGTDASAGLSIVGAPHALVAQATQRASVQQGFAGLTPSARQLGNMPKGVTGFVSGGVTAAPSSYGERVGVQSDQRNWHVGAGLETEISKGLTVGTAFGYAAGSSAPGLDRTSSKMAQAALYGSYRLGDGFYVGGVAAVERAEADQSRHASDGQSMLDLHGAAESVRYSAVAEAGVNIAAARGVTLTPRVQLGYADYRIGGFRENGGELALQIDDMKLQRLEARMGARLAGATRIGDGWSLMPQIQADYVQLLSGSTDGMQVRFANAGDHAFMLPLAGGDASWGEVKGGVKLTKGRLEFGAGVETAVGRSAFRDDRAVADITFRF